MRITKVYTKTGDKGITGLVDGSRVSKNHPRIEAYGTVDELNAIIGIIRTFLNDSKSNQNLEKLRHAKTVLYDSIGAGMTRSSFLERKK